MASIIRIKRSSGVLAPITLKTAEMAYTYGVGTSSNKGDRLFIGTGNDGSNNATSITVIGGSYFTDMLDHVKGTLTANSAITVDSDQKIDKLLSGDIVIDGTTNTITTPGKILYSNVYDSLGALPSASTYHGMFAHVHATGKGYYAHAGNWVPLSNKDDLDSAIANISQEFSFTGDAGSDTVTLADSSLRFQGIPGQMLAVVTDNRVQLGLQATNVTPGNYGSATKIPTIEVDHYGRIDSVGEASIELTGGLGMDVTTTATGTTIAQTSSPLYPTLTTYGAGVIATSATTTPRLEIDETGRIQGVTHLGTQVNIGLIDSLGSNAYGATFTAGGAGFDNRTIGVFGNFGVNSTLEIVNGGASTPGRMAWNLSIDSAAIAGTVAGISSGVWSSDSNAVVISTTDSNEFKIVIDGFDSSIGLNAVHSTSGYGISIADSAIFKNDENLVFGNGYIWNGNPVPGRTTMRLDTTDHWFEMLADSYTTGIEIAGRGVTLRGYDLNYGFRSGQGAVTGHGYIELDGNIVPAVGLGQGLYNQGFRRNLGRSGNRFGTLFVDSVDRGQVVDSGTYGSATAIPVFTVNKSGLIDSIGTVASSGIDSASWHPSDNTLKITTDAETVHSVQIDDFDTDISIAIDKYINFGTGGKIRKESVDQHLQVINNGTVSIIGTGIDLLSTANDPFKNISIRGHLRPTYFPAAGGFDIGESADWTFRNAFFSGNVTSRTDAVDSNHLVLKRQVDSDITSVTLDSASWDKDTHNLNLTIGGNVTQVTINEFDNVKIDGNTISSTDSSNRLFIDPFPVGDSGDLVIRGNLIVQGTETIVNSSVVSLNDKNLVLADSAANSGIADGAGITIGGAGFTGTKPKFVFDAATDRWDPNLPLDIPFASLDSAIFFNGVALREVVEDHLDNFFGVDSNAALSLTYNDVANSMTWKAINATKSQVGVSSFDSANFSVTAGHVAVTVLDGGTY